MKWFSKAGSKDTHTHLPTLSLESQLSAVPSLINLFLEPHLPPATPPDSFFTSWKISIYKLIALKEVFFEIVLFLFVDS